MPRSRAAAMLDERFILVAFVVLAVVLALRHELWRDEWQAWLIARDSRSLGEILTNTRYEGHPPLWYFVLWGAARVSRHVFAMQLVNVAIGSATAAVVLWRAPFSRGVRAALVFGYFPLYEYGTIARSYGLGLLLLVSVCAVASRRPRRPVAISVLLGLMMLASAHALLVATAVAGALVLDAAIERRRAGHSMRPSPGLCAGAAILASAFVWSIVQITPPSDGAYGVGLSTPSDARSTVPPFDHVAIALVGHREVPAMRIFHAGALLVGLLIVVGVAWRLQRRPAALALWSTGVGLLIGLAWLRYSGSIRHFGHHYMVALAAFWLEPSFVERRAGVTAGRGRGDRLFAVAVAVALSAQLVTGARAAAKDLVDPYTPTAAAAKWVRENGLEDATLIGYPDATTLSIGAILDRPMLFLEQNRVGTFVLWRNDRHDVTDGDVVAAAQQLVDDGQTVVVLALDPLKGDLGPLRRGPGFTDAILGGEWIFVYHTASDLSVGDR